MAEKEGSAQLGTAQAINKLLEERSALLDKQSDQLSQQVSIAMELCKALECEDLDGIEERMQGMTAAMKEAQEEAQQTGDDLEEAMKKAADAAEDATESTTGSGGFFSKLTPAVGAAVGAIGGFGLGLSGIFGLMKAGIKGVFGLVKAFGKLAFSIIMIPFKMLSGLISMAQEEMGGGSPLREAIEETREAFESLSEGVGGTVMRGFRQMRKEAGNLAGSGRTLSSIFGPGAEGLAESLKFTNEMTKAFGLSVGIVNNLSKKAFGQMVIYRKAMNLSAEATANIMSRAMDLGVDPMKAMHKFASAAKMMAKSAKVDFKVIAKGMTEVMEDLDNFGHLGESAMAAVAAYAAKTGMEIKTLGQMTQKFLNFEDAAKSAAQLNQALGMNLDTMKLMKGGADAVDEINRAFKATGRTYKDLSSAEKAMISQATGLQGAQLQAALGERTKRNEMKKFNKQAKQQERMIMNQEKLMKQLGKMIKKVFGSGSKQFKGFFDAFIQGFDRGVKKSQPMRKLFRNITKSLYATHKAGRQVGRDFVNFFPGFKEFIKGLSEFFSPAKFKPMLGEVTKIFRQFFKTLETDPDGGFETFFKRLKETFLKFFGGQGGAVKSVLGGGKKILMAFGSIFKNLLIKAAEGLAFLINKLADIIQNPAPLATAASKAFSALGKAFGKIFKIFAERIGPPLMDALGNLFTVVAKRLKNSEFIKSAVGVLGKIFIAKLMLSMLANSIKGGAVIAIGKKIAMALTAVIRPLPGGAGAIGGAGSFWPTLFGAANSAAVPASQGNVTATPAATSGALKLATFITVGLAAVGAAALVLIPILGGVKMSSIKKVGMFALAMAGMIIPIIGIAYAATVANATDPATATAGMTKIAMIMGGLGIVGVVLVGLLKAVGKVEISTMLGFLAVMVGMTLAAIPVYMAAVAIGVIATSTAGISEGALLIGLLSLAVVMGAVGYLGVKIVELLGSVKPDQAKTAGLLMFPLAAMLAVVGAVLMPALILAGIIAVSGFGLGAMALLAGLATLAMVVKNITDPDTGIIAAITRLAKVPIANPEGVANIVKAVSSLVKAAAAMMVGLSKIINQADDFADDTTEMDALFKNINSTVDALMKNGIVAIIDKLIALAKSKDIGENADKAMGAIANAIKAAASFMQAVQFPDSFYAMMEEIDDDEEIANILCSIRGIMGVMIDQLTGENGVVNMLLKKLLSGDFMAALNKMPNPDKIAQFVNSIAGLIKAVTGIMGAIGMDKNTADVLNKLTKDDNDETVGALKEVRLMMENNIKAMGGVLKQMFEGIGDMIGKLDPIFKTLDKTKASADKLAAGAQLMGAVLNPISSLVTGAMPVILKFAETTNKGAEDAPQEDAAKKMTDSMNKLKTFIENVILSINKLDLKNLMGGITKAISDSGLGPKRMEAATKMLAPIMNMITSVVSTTTQLATDMVKAKVKPPSNAATDKAKEVAAAGESSKGIIGAIGDMIEKIDLGPVIKKVVAQLKKNRMNKSTIASVKALVSFMNGLMKMMSTMTQIMGSTEADLMKDPDYRRMSKDHDYSMDRALRQAGAGEDYTTSEQNAMDHARLMAKRRTELIERKIPELIKMMEQTIDQLNTKKILPRIVALMGKIPPLPKRMVERAKNMVSLISSLSGMVAAMGSDNFDSATEKPPGGGGGPAILDSFSQDLIDLETKVLKKDNVDKMVKIAFKLRRVGGVNIRKKNVENANRVLSHMQHFSQVIPSLQGGTMDIGKVAENLEKLADAISHSANKLERLKGIGGKAGSNLVQIATALTTAGGKLKIQHEDIVFNLDVNVVIDAERMEKKLGKTKARGKSGKAQPSDTKKP